MADDGAAPEVEIQPAAVELIHEKGGKLYLSVDGAGMEHIHFSPPHHYPAHGGWPELDAGGIRLYIDPEIETPDTWVIRCHHFPYRHIQALWNGEELETGQGGGVFLSSAV